MARCEKQVPKTLSRVPIPATSALDHSLSYQRMKEKWKAGERMIEGYFHGQKWKWLRDKATLCCNQQPSRVVLFTNSSIYFHMNDTKTQQLRVCNSPVVRLLHWRVKAPCFNLGFHHLLFLFSLFQWHCFFSDMVWNSFSSNRIGRIWVKRHEESQKPNLLYLVCSLSSHLTYWQPISQLCSPSISFSRSFSPSPFLSLFVCFLYCLVSGEDLVCCISPEHKVLPHLASVRHILRLCCRSWPLESLEMRTIWNHWSVG